MKSESFTWPPVLYQVHGFYVNELYFIGVHPEIDNDPIANRSAFYVVKDLCHAVMVRQEFVEESNYGYFINIEEAKTAINKKIRARIKDLKCQK